jgi:hypothetical protein
MRKWEAIRKRLSAHPDWLLFLALFAVIVLVRAALDGPLDREPLAQGDCIEYLRVSRYPFPSHRLLAGERAPVLPLLLKACGRDFVRLSVVQALVSCLVWAFLGCALARHLRSKTARAVIAVAVALVATSTVVTSWDREPLSESLALSSYALVSALLLEMLRAVGSPDGLPLRRGIPLVGAVLGSTAALVFVRDGNIVAGLAVAALFAGFLVLPRWRAGMDWRLAFVGLAAAGCLLALNVQNAGCRFLWRNALYNVYLNRVLTDPGRTAFMLERGMPVGDSVQPFIGNGYWHENQKVYRLHELRRWMGDHGAPSYAAYLLTHPGYTFGVFAGEGAAAFSASLSFYFSGYPYDGAFPQGRTLIESLVHFTGKWPFWVGLAGALAAPVAALLLGRRRVAIPLALAWFFGCGMLMMALIVHGDTFEVARHCLLPVVSVRVGVWFLVALSVDAVVTRLKSGDTVDPAEGGRLAGNP